ncbi:MAG: PIG-L family deacetylase, partial [Kofleriaceae bacterium]|nr:PIG-L family deacetylase [Kofleriaceae bacterium]
MSFRNGLFVLQQAPKRLAGQFPAQRQRLRGVLDRARKRIHRASYWRALAQQYPILGHTSERIESELANRFGDQVQAGVQPLPGLALRGGSLYYWDHPLPNLGQDDSKALSALVTGAETHISPSLRQSGLLVETSETSSAKSQALVVSPHQDDAALSIGGTIAARRDNESHVICNVFTISGWLGKGFRPSPLASVTKIRQAEEDLSNRILSATGLGLGLWEAEVANFYRRAVDNYPTRIGFVFADDPLLRTLGERDSIHRGLKQVVRAISPSRIYFPLGLGSHMDHVYLASYGREQALGLKKRNPECEIYFFEDQPYATYDEVDVPTIVEQLSSGTLKLEAEFQNITKTFETKIQS